MENFMGELRRKLSEAAKKKAEEPPEPETEYVYDPDEIYQSLIRWIADLPVGARNMAERPAKILLEMAKGERPVRKKTDGPMNPPKSPES